MDTGLNKKTVLLSGASGGIGSEIARMFDIEGSRQILTYLPDERGKAEVEDLKTTLKGEFILVPADLTVESEVDKIFVEADKKYGRIDVLVACAGVWSDTKFIADRTLEEWNKAFQLNSTADLPCRKCFHRIYWLNSRSNR